MATERSPDRPDRTLPRTVKLQTSAGSPAARITASVKMTIGGQPLCLEISVPEGPTRADELLPVLQGLTDAVVGIAEQGVARQGLEVSCRKGCGACCRQLVPLVESETHRLARLVAALPEPRRSQVRARFAAALQRLAAAGLLDQLRQPSRVPDVRLQPLGLDYFHLGLACPFLEDESCSIHADRPLACREYLVTSPAEDCAHPSPEIIRRVPLPVSVAGAVRAMGQEASAAATSWVPLVLALEWAGTHAEGPPRTGPSLLREFFEQLTKEAIPAPPGEKDA